MGHGTHLSNGIMYRLHLAVMQWLCSRQAPCTEGIACLVYAGFYQGAPGLGQWKRKALFRPAYLIEPASSSEFTGRGDHWTSAITGPDGA